MKRLLLALTLVSVPALAPAGAQTYEEQRRWEAAQARYDAETELYQRERDRYMAARARDRGYGRDRYDVSPPPPPGPDPYAIQYDAARDYRDAPGYQERRLTARDQVYRGSDGRYYCRRSDGSVGLVVGGASGALLGNVIDGGRNRVAGTLIGGALGALVGRAIDQNNSDIRCR